MLCHLSPGPVRRVANLFAWSSFVVCRVAWSNFVVPRMLVAGSLASSPSYSTSSLRCNYKEKDAVSLASPRHILAPLSYSARWKTLKVT
ncbi:uncharacterized protein DS421_14g459780 [Arachis hypogaea]|nr:uncharacterized protein DS421_14g459780 [Arachis hypogaea]